MVPTLFAPVHLKRLCTMFSVLTQTPTYIYARDLIRISAMPEHQNFT